MRPDFNSASFEGVIHHIVPANSNYTGDPEERTWIVYVETTLKLRQRPVWIKFKTNQAPFPYLAANQRIGKGFRLSFSGRITSILEPSRFTDGNPGLSLSDVRLFTDNLYFLQDVIYTTTCDGDYDPLKEPVEF